ncbi:MAG TPA: glycosyltransferase family 4 protein, partial [Polyangiales bacterium]|nr:glycosyltransferase family 4 protein [Polyangiales bacterium]
MRIAYLVSQYPAASHTFIRREIEALRAAGFSIDTFSIREPSAAERGAGPDRREYESTFYVLPFQAAGLLGAHASALAQSPLRYLRTLGLAMKHRVPGAKAFALSLAHFAESIIVARELERREIRHVHNHFANSGATVGFLATRFLGLPWSLTLHGISETDYPAGLLLGAKLEAADFAACVSHFGMAQAMRTVSPDHWSKFTIVRCALDLRGLPARPAVRRERLRVVCVGRLSPEKGHIGLLEAFAAVRRRGQDAELVLVGDGPDRERIERRIAELGLADAVQLRGRLFEAETLQEIAGSDVLVLASFMEGLPVVLMEAMALGLPVIAPRVAGVPELVQDGVHGLLFAPGAWHELADCLHKLLSDA